MITATIALLAAHVTVTQDTTRTMLLQWTRDALANSPPFLPGKGSDQPGPVVGAGWRREVDRAPVSVYVFDLSADADPENFWIQIQGALHRRPEYEFFSGPPVVGECRPSTSAGSANLTWREGMSALTSTVAYLATGPKNNRVWHKEDPEGDRALVEGVARAVIGGLLGSKSVALVDARVGGRSVGARRGRGGQTCWSLWDWSQAIGAQLTVNHKTGLAQVVYRGEAIIVPLGSDKLKVGSKSVSLQEPVFQLSGEWFVEAAALGRL